MIVTGLLAVTAVGLLLLALLWGAQRAHLREGRPGAAAPLPPVSILKPLKGVDPGLEANLASFFSLDYPDYEIVLGVQDEADPALVVARRVAAAHPGVPAVLVTSARAVGHNPKVNNLANLARRARFETLLISDSNVRVAPGTLREQVAHLEEPGVGLVTSLIRAVDARGLGGGLESLQLNTFVMGGAAAVQRLLGGVCCVGKSMLMRRSDLDAIGGFPELARYLAEDQVCGEALAARGRRVVVAPVVVDNVLGPVDLAGFVRRHLRWARIRARMHPVAYAGEVLLAPLVPAAAALVLAPELVTAAAACAAVLLSGVMAWSAELRLGVRRPLPLSLLLEGLRQVVVAAVWPVAFLSRQVEWRGSRFRIGKRTLLDPVGDPAAAEPGPAEPELEPASADA